MAFALIGYHVSGDERIKGELRRLVRDVNRLGLEISSINFLNRYVQYYGNNLGHTNWYNTLRLEKVYLGEADYLYLVDLFNRAEHTFTRLSHNAWFNQVYMSQGGWERRVVDDPYYDQLIEDLGDFRSPPHHEYALPARDPETCTVDPTSVALDQLFEQIPLLKELLGDANPQALEAFPVPLQCSSDFLWQRNPFRIEACGVDDPTQVHPGVDYLLAYWLASYHKYVDKSM